MIKYSILNELGQLVNELPAAERLAFAKRTKKEKGAIEVFMAVGTPAYWYIYR